MRKSETANSFSSMEKIQRMTTQEPDRPTDTYRKTAGIVSGPNCKLCVRPSWKQTGNIQSQPSFSEAKSSELLWPQGLLLEINPLCSIGLI